jgi:ribosomal protein S18 acetylase RimI-like enzyme
LLDAMRRTLQSGLAAAVLVVDPKDEQAARFYYRYGFLDIGPGRRRLYMPVTEIKKALS